MASLRKLAQLSGVSVATVSRALSEKGTIKPETKKRIRELAERLNYRPNLLVEGVIKGRTRTVAYIGDLAAETHGRHLDSMIDHLLDNGFATLVLNSHNDPEREMVCIKRAVGFRVSGVLCCPTLSTEDWQRFEELRLHDIAILAAADYSPHNTIHFIHASDYETVTEVVQRLLEWGHREFAYVAGPPDTVRRMKRFEGYCDALRAAGLALPSSRIIETDWSPEDSRRKTAAFLRKHPQVTVLFGATDRIASGAMSAAADLGRRPGSDISIFGMGNLEISRATTPTLTTIGHNHRAWGQEAAEKLLVLMKKPKASFIGPRRTLETKVEGEIFWRDSTGPLVSAVAR